VATAGEPGPGSDAVRPGEPVVVSCEDGRASVRPATEAERKEIEAAGIQVFAIPGTPADLSPTTDDAVRVKGTARPVPGEEIVDGALCTEGIPAVADADSVPAEPAVAAPPRHEELTPGPSTTAARRPARPSAERRRASRGGHTRRETR
jgi:hypothetical protein